MAKTSEHSGHRQRMKKRYLEQGLETFEPHEMLELALYYAIPMKDTNPIAHRLLNKFGSLSAVFDAPIELLKEEGLSDNTAVFLKLIPDLLSVYMDDKFNNTDRIVSAETLPDKFINKFLGKDYEMVYLLLTDSKFKEIYCGIVSKGSVTNASINIPKICSLAVRYSARYAIIAHNHPSGICLPSNADIRVTTKLYQALKCINVELVDHFIVAENDCISLKESRVFFRTEEEFQKSCVADVDINL